MWFASRQTLVLRGLVTIAFGLLLVVWPVVSLAVLVLLFGAFALVDGALIVTSAVRTPHDEPGRTAAIIGGALAIAVGLATFVWPGLTQMALLVLIALRAIVIGALEIGTAVYICRQISGNRPALWLLGGIGAISLLFGVLLLAYPVAGLLALVWVVGLYAIAVGLTLIVKAWLLTLSLQTV